jgi:hypothetical protein
LNFKEIAIGIPLLIQIKPNDFYIAMGVLFEFPLISKVFIRSVKNNVAKTDIDFKKESHKSPDIGIIPFAYGFVINNTIKLDNRISYSWPNKNFDYGILRIDLGLTVYLIKW